MCYNCGCGNKHDNMGDPQNITEETFINIANAMSLSLDEAKLLVYHSLEKQKENKYKDTRAEEKDIKGIFTHAAGAWGQSVEEAKNYTYELLKQEINKKKKI